MSTESEARRVQDLFKQLEQLNRSLETESRNEASMAGDLARTRSSLAQSTPSLRAQRQREADQKARSLLEIQKRKAEIQGKVAGKSAELSRAQGSLLQAQLQESKERSRAEKRLREEREERERALHTELETLKNSPAGRRSARGPSSKTYDLFISHASDDKGEVVRPLVQLLKDLGVSVWLDELVMKVGDSLRRRIDDGLATSRFGVVVLSPAFFQRNWPQYELDGLVARENASGEKVVLPIWHRLTKDEVLAVSPTLADRLALNTSVNSLSEIARELAEVVRDAV